MGATALLALSLAVSVYGAISFARLSVAAGATPGFAVGRLLLPLLWCAIQAWLLFKLLQGRNWARIFVFVVVALAVVSRYVAINSVSLQLFGAASLILALLQTMAELLAVLLLVMAGSYFARRARGEPE